MGPKLDVGLAVWVADRGQDVGVHSRLQLGGGWCWSRRGEAHLHHHCGHTGQPGGFIRVHLKSQDTVVSVSRS